MSGHRRGSQAHTRRASAIRSLRELPKVPLNQVAYSGAVAENGGSNMANAGTPIRGSTIEAST